MKKLGKFAITLAAAGYLPQEVQGAAGYLPLNKPDDKFSSLFQILRGEHKYTLAKHRSHSSHGSHGSHRSSSGGGYSGGSGSTSPAIPYGNSTPPSYVMPSVPQAPLTLPGNSGKFQEIVRQVQTALFAYGYFTGAIDGTVGTDTKIALSKFQEDWGLTITGTITPEVLDALNIVAN